MRAQVREQLEHGLVHEVGVRALEARVPRRGQPAPDDGVELLRRHPRVGGRDQLQETPVAARRQGFHIPVQHRLERLSLAPLRMRRRERLHAVQGKGELDVHRLLDPEGSVVVERRDALLGRDVVWAGRVGHRLDELDDALLGGPVVPGGQGVGLGAGVEGTQERGEQRQEPDNRHASAVHLHVAIEGSESPDDGLLDIGPTIPRGTTNDRRRLQGRLEINYLTDRSLEDVLTQIAALPAQTVLLVGTFQRDVTGQSRDGGGSPLARMGRLGGGHGSLQLTARCPSTPGSVPAGGPSL